MAITAGFEDGVNGNTIATTDGGDATPWNAVSVGTGGTAVYDNTVAHSGSLSGKLTRGSAGRCELVWSTALGTVTDHYWRAYVYLAAWPAAAFALIQARSGGSNAINVRLTEAGILILRNAAGSNAASTTIPIATGKWVRIEGHFIHDASNGSAELKLFNVTDSIVPTQTISFSGSGTLASADRITFASDVNASYVVQWDDIRAGDTSYPGPTNPQSVKDITGGLIPFER